MKSNGSVLKPIKWFDNKENTRSETTTIICEYDIYKYDDQLMRKSDNIKDKESVNTWVVAYYNRQTEEPTKEALGFNTMQDAKEWCWNNYKMHMQPYFNCKL